MGKVVWALPVGYTRHDMALHILYDCFDGFRVERSRIRQTGREIARFDLASDRVFFDVFIVISQEIYNHVALPPEFLRVKWVQHGLQVLSLRRSAHGHRRSAHSHRRLLPSIRLVSSQRAKDFLSSIKDIEHRFFRASESGKEVSRMLEASKIRVGYSDAKGGSAVSDFLAALRLTCCRGNAVLVSHGLQLQKDERSLSGKTFFKPFLFLLDKISSFEWSRRRRRDGGGRNIFGEEMAAVVGAARSIEQRCWQQQRREEDGDADWKVAIDSVTFASSITFADSTGLTSTDDRQSLLL
ncbi:hypothetical protein RHGRI_036817 [Rhododendron griersonianum]|uniref:DUF632 domain-containing protein n=1 Tax=Rhododendron griersonianum TaxID=479676 RepID=A0AAV6HPC2_9ERIC|nr:hypothetical protein RHGRI_036817 [Rhododendron griersonianum]